MDIRDGSFISQPLHPRQQGMEYYVDHRNDRFYIITNAKDKNYRVRMYFNNLGVTEKFNIM